MLIIIQKCCSIVDWAWRYVDAEERKADAMVLGLTGRNHIFGWRQYLCLKLELVAGKFSKTRCGIGIIVVRNRYDVRDFFVCVKKRKPVDMVYLQKDVRKEQNSGEYRVLCTEHQALPPINLFPQD